MNDCGENCEVYSRIVGYFRPVQNWNIGKKEEFKQRPIVQPKVERLLRKHHGLGTTTGY